MSTTHAHPTAQHRADEMHETPPSSHTFTASKVADQADSNLQIFGAMTAAALPVRSAFNCSGAIIRGSFGAFHHFLEANQVSRNNVMASVTGIRSPLDVSGISEVQRDVSDYFQHVLDNELILVSDLMHVASDAVSQLQGGNQKAA